MLNYIFNDGNLCCVGSCILYEYINGMIGEERDELVLVSSTLLYSSRVRRSTLFSPVYPGKGPALAATAAAMCACTKFN